MEDKRLDRIEGKLDKLADAMENLARIDERMMHLFKRMDKYDNQQEVLTERVTAIESTNVKQGSKVDWVERIIWIAVVAVVTLLVNMGFVE